MLNTRVNDLSEKRFATIKIYDHMMRGMRRYCEDSGYTMIHGIPTFFNAAGSCELFDATFKVEGSEEYFGKQAFGVQSAQLMIEMLTPKFKKVACDIISSRAEKCLDRRHLSQFALFELEVLGDLELLINEIEKCIRGAVKQVVLNCQDELKIFNRDISKLLDLSFYRIKYEDAIKLLNNNGHNLTFGDDFTHEQEILLTKFHDDSPVFLTHHPKEIKFFSMVVDPEDDRVCKSCDLILPFSGESAGSSERIVSYKELKTRLVNSEMYRQMLERGVREEEFDWYLDHHKNNDIPIHSGAGLGTARINQWLLGQGDIKESVPFVLTLDAFK